MSDRDEPDALAALLRGYRKRAGLSQRQLAKSAGVGERTIRDLERGLVARPQRATIDCVADALRLGPDDRASLQRITPKRRDDPSARLRAQVSGPASRGGAAGARTGQASVRRAW